MGAEFALKNQILYYYLFHRKLELFFKGQYNPFDENNKERIKLEKYYIISKDFLEKWKESCNYYLYKTYLDKVDFYDITIEEYMKELEQKIRQLIFELKPNNILKIYSNEVFSEYNFYSKSILKIEDFGNIIDEETYEYFKDILSEKIKSNIKGIITSDKLIIFYEEFFQIKFFYYGQSINLNQGIENKNLLLQLTADFSQISNGIYDKYYTQDAYNGFKNLIQSNVNFAFKLFDNKNINYSKKEIINFSTDIGNGIIISYNFILRNDNLNSGFVDQINKINNSNNKPQKYNSHDNDFNDMPKKNNSQNESQIKNYQQKNNNYNYDIEINELKKKLKEEKDKNKKLAKENKNLQEKINKLNVEINQMRELKEKFENDLSLKNNEIQKLLSQNKKDYYDISSLRPNDKIITVNFVSMGNSDIGRYSLICKYRDLFVKLEERLYNDFPKFKEYETFFEVNGKRLRRFKTLEQNKIKNNDIINIFIFEE